MFSSAVIVGRIGKNPESRTVGNTEVVTTSVAVETGFGERKKTTWYKLEIWGKSAASFMQYAGTGDLVVANGELTLDEYARKSDGVTKQIPKLNAREWRLVPGGRREGGTSPSPRPKAPVPATPPPQHRHGDPNADPENPPF